MYSYYKMQDEDGHMLNANFSMNYGHALLYQNKLGNRAFYDTLFLILLISLQFFDQVNIFFHFPSSTLPLLKN